MDSKIAEIEKGLIIQKTSNFKSGDTITVFYKIKEGEKKEFSFLKEMSYKEKAVA